MESSDELGLLLSRRRKEIEDEMDRLQSSFGISHGNSSAAGCLRLEKVYCVKHGKRYGPYGPYYYLYFHRPEGMEKRYLGRMVDRFVTNKEGAARFRELEREYERILSLERAISGVEE